MTITATVMTTITMGTATRITEFDITHLCETLAG